MAEKENVLIYGLGNFYLENEKNIEEQYSIHAYVDKNKKGCYLDKEIITLEDVNNYQYDKILIMIQNIQQCLDVIREMIFQKGVPYHKIILGHSNYGIYSNVLDKLIVLQDGNLELTVGNVCIKVNSLDEFVNTCEVLANGVYDYYINNGKKDVVIDIGMNIGDSTCYFLSKDNVIKVYGYEPFKKTFLNAKENLKKNVEDESRFEVFQYGLSNANKTQTVNFNVQLSCGQSSNTEAREKSYIMYEGLGLVRPEDEKEEIIEIKKSSEILRPIFSEYRNDNIILKIDCEGEEYAIMEDLEEEGLLQDISLIMMEWHYRGKEELLVRLKNAGFSYWCMSKDMDMGIIYAYKNI